MTCNETLFAISTPTQIPELDLQLPVQSVSSTYKTDRHYITEILLKVALNIITLIHIQTFVT